MKKFFTLPIVALFAFVGGVDAQNYRKWDFTNWSAQTVANLQADAAASSTTGWSDIEKAADAGEGKVAPDATRDKCFWYASSEDGELKANGQTIAELEGLYFGSSYGANRSLAIAVNYPETSLGTYAGPAYLWLGGGNKAAGSRLLCFTIPKVRIGQKITMVAESHKPSEARGVSLFVNDVNVDANQIGESFKPTTLETYTWEDWTLPEGIEDEDEDGLVDILVYNTNGCHIYSIEIGDNTQKSKVAYLYNGNIDEELAYNLIAQNEMLTVDPIEAVGTLTADVLTAYDVVTVSSTVTDAEAIASLKAIQPFVPVLNLNPAIYEAWGYGAVGTDESDVAIVLNAGHALFRNLDIFENEGINGLMLTEYPQMAKGVTLNSDGYFGNDVVLATLLDSEDIAIHGHNLDHNGYLFLPYTQETLAAAASPALLTNAISVLMNTKAPVSQAPRPTITLEYKDMKTNVTLKSSVTSARIFYTIDGTTPTTESTEYTEPFTISTEGVTVKAVALGDGYLLSEVAEQEIDLRKQVAAPEIILAAEEGKTTVTFTAAEGADVYYNYDGNTNTTKSSKYYADSLAIVITKGKTIYAFAVAEGYVNSELASKYVDVQNPKVRIDVLAHMDANSDEYYEKSNKSSSSAGYFFSWGKDKASYPYYVLDSRKEESAGTDPETGDELWNVTYTEMSPEEEVDFENGWAVRSRGQLVILETLSATDNIGDTSSRNPATADDINPDFPITKNFVNLADKNTTPADGQGFPYNAYIVTTEKIAGPFDVVANIGNGAGAESRLGIVFQVSTDGNVWESNWQTIGDTIEIVNGQRLYRNITRSYEGTDEVYVRVYLCANNSKAQVYDVYIANAGEKSQEYLTGVEEVKQEVKAIPAGIYNLNGVRQTTLQRGFNIVRYSDGTTKKVMVK